MATPAPPSVEELGVRGAWYLLALTYGTDARLPIAPTTRATLVLLGFLRDFKIIEVPWPETRWPLRPDAEDTPLEGLQWRYAWPAYARANLSRALTDFLEDVPYSEAGLSCRLQYWDELSLDEAESFFEQQLAKHHFAPGWARDLAYVHRQLEGQLTISQWRYCVWAAVRHGGSLAQQQPGGDPATIRDAIYSELRRRVGFGRGGQWSQATLPPFNRSPRSALGRMFVRHLARKDLDYWDVVPSLAALKPLPREAGGGN